MKGLVPLLGLALLLPGLFDAAAPVTPGFSYRIVYVDAATGVPYARLIRP